MVRALRPEDAEDWVDLRQESLGAAPHAFLSSPSDDWKSNLETARKRLEEGSASITFGAFEAGLVGSVTLFPDAHLKAAHKVHIVAMYVRPAHRRTGHARRLLRAALDYARTLEGVSQVQLSVSSRAPEARQLYESFGFRSWGTEEDALRVDATSSSETHMVLDLARRTRTELGSPGTDDHTATVRREFARQVESFARSPDLRTPEVTKRVVESLREASVERILDVACGPGILSEALCQRATTVVGLDLTAQTLRVARDQASGSSGAHFVLGRAERAPFSEASFDAAIVRLALHHFEDPAGVLKTVRGLLRPQGRLVVLDILTSADPGLAELHNAIERLRDPSHTRFVHEQTLTSWIHGAGFELNRETRWSTDRRFDGWARIIAEPKRMAALEKVLRQLARSGEQAGIGLREEDGELWFTYRWGLFVADLHT